jgi:hypothetical protein
MKYDKLTQKKKELVSVRSLPIELANNLDNWFRVDLLLLAMQLKEILLRGEKRPLLLRRGLL